VLAGPSSGSAAAPTWRSLEVADLPTGTTASTVALGNHTHSGYATTSELDNYLLLSGGTLTGALTMNAKYIHLDSSNIDTTTPPSSGTTGNSRIQMRDKNDTVIAQFCPYISSAGRYGTQFGTSNNWVYMTTDGSSAYVSVTSAAAWRTALGLGDAATMDTGTSGTTVALGNHTHSQYYNSSTSRTANTVLAAPNGSAGAATFRKLVVADLPTGTTASTVALGNHTHAASAITSGELAEARIPTLSASKIKFEGYAWVSGATPTSINCSSTAYTSAGTAGWTYYKYLADGASMVIYHAFGVVKFKNTAITTAHGGGYINASNLYIRLPKAARVIKSATFGTAMGGGLLGVTFLAAGGTGDWKKTTDTVYNLPVRLFSPVSQAATNSNNDNQFIPVDIWFTATS
jgi:hypothetical protein